MAQVSAVLQVANTTHVSDVETATVTPSPAAVSLIGVPSVVVWISSTDLSNSQVKYGYMAYQTYSAAGGATGMASVSGTTDWVSIPQVSTDFPNIGVTATITSSLSAGVMTFAIAGRVNYTQTIPGIYTVTTA